MENSLRNHALVHQQNQQQQRDREEFYRNNGIIRSSSAMSGGQTGSTSYQHQHQHQHQHRGNPNNGTNNNSNISCNRSRTSGSTTSGSRSASIKSSRSSSSGQASDEAVQGLPQSMAQHNRCQHDQHALHRQQQQQQQQYGYHYAQHDQHPMHPNYHPEQQQQTQRYLQQYHHYMSSSANSRTNQHHHQQGPYGYRGNSYTSASQHSSSYQQQQLQQQQSYNYSVSEDQNSHYSNILGSISGSHQSIGTDDAYRRLGKRLSLGAHGIDNSEFSQPASRAVATTIQYRTSFRSPASCFKPFPEVLQDVRQERERLGRSNEGIGNGSHKKASGNLIRNLTMKVNDLCRVWHAEQSRTHQRRRRKSNGSNTGAAANSLGSTNSKNKPDNLSMSPHRRSFAQTSLSGNTGSYGHSHNSIISSSSKKQHGSLSAVIESASQASSTGTNQRGGGSKGADASARSENLSRASSTTTRSSLGTLNSLRSFGTLPPRGKCLTQPSEGVSNDNLCDNAEGNLIVYENDNISIPKKQVHVLTKGKVPRGHKTNDFRIQSLLGQGTFAQVFKCLHVQTGQFVALKIVKNKPAYTRQAAIEIDVIRVANESNVNANRNAKTGTKEVLSQQQQHQSKPSTTDYMIDLVCYFMYKDHLCLAFELLGLNLFEVLKKRQFRGLPLSVTQNFVRQAVLGCRALAQKSIVHCDLKPENILLVDEGDEESVMSAGESKRLLAAMSSTSLEKKQRDYLQNMGSCRVPPDKNENDYGNNGESTTAEPLESSRNMGEKDVMKHNGREQEEEQLTETTESSVTTKVSPGERKNSRPKSPMDSTIATNDTHQERIKLIDFGSACFEGQMSHTYIQSRFYRSPEVILGLAYDSAIDMWSLGCVAAELFLGLPILPGVHEHDQLVRITEMIGETPDWMLDQGTKSSKYFMKYFPAPTPAPTPPTQSSTSPGDQSLEGVGSTSGRSTSEGPRPLPQWRIKSQQEFIASLSQSEVKKRGGLAKLEKQPGNRYFKRKLLSDIILQKGQSAKQEDLRLLKSFIHFLYGILDPDPWKRWTAYQVASHPFLTGAAMMENVHPSVVKDENHANKIFNMYWEAPSDPTIYQRKLRSVQKTRERQQAARRSYNRNHSRSRSESPASQDTTPTMRKTSPNTNNSLDGTHSARGHMDEAMNQAAARHIRQGSNQGPHEGYINMSSSMTQFESDPRVRIVGYGSSFSGVQPILTGPQSFSEMANSIALPESFSEADFALALRRPGVVPMGDSVTTATTSTTSLSSGNNSRSNFNQSGIQVCQVGSYGSHQILYDGSQQRTMNSGAISRTSRSFGEGDIPPSASTTVPTVIDSLHQQMLYASSHESVIDTVQSLVLKGEIDNVNDPPSEIQDESILKRPESPTSAKSAGEGSDDEHLQRAEAPPPSKDVTAGGTQKKEVFDNSQAYQQTAYQQQLAAMQQQFQQQQLILQQQQAALAIQQEQLRAYYSAAGMAAHPFGLAGAPASAAAGMSSQQFGLAGNPSTMAAGMNAQQFGLPGAPAASLNANQLGLPGAPGTAATGMNPQQFGLPGAPAASLNANQLGLAGAPGTAATGLNPQQFGIPGAPAASLSANQVGLPGVPGASTNGMNPQQFGLTGAPATAAAGLNPQQFGLAGAPSASVNAQQYGHSNSAPAPTQSPALSTNHLGGGYFLVTAADGTQMVVAASNPAGMAIPMSGQIPGIGPMPGVIPGQIQGLATHGAHLQGLTAAGLPSAGVTSQGQAVHGMVDMAVGMPGIPGLHPVGMIPTAGTLPGLTPATAKTAMSAGLNNPEISDDTTNGISQQQTHRQS